MNEITLSEAKRLKEELEKKIGALLDEFERVTDCSVERLDVSTRTEHDGNRFIHYYTVDALVTMP